MSLRVGLQLGDVRRLAVRDLRLALLQCQLLVRPPLLRDLLGGGLLVSRVRSDGGVRLLVDALDLGR